MMLPAAALGLLYSLAGAQAQVRSLSIRTSHRSAAAHTITAPWGPGAGHRAGYGRVLRLPRGFLVPLTVDNPHALHPPAREHKEILKQLGISPHSTLHDV